MQEKIEAIAKETYGAASVEYLPQAEKQIELYTKMGFAGLPICMAKTQYSFTADAAAKVSAYPLKIYTCASAGRIDCFRAWCAAVEACSLQALGASVLAKRHGCSGM